MRFLGVLIYARCKRFNGNKRAQNSRRIVFLVLFCWLFECVIIRTLSSRYHV